MRQSLLAVVPAYAIFGAVALYLHFSSMSAITNPFEVCNAVACSGPDLGLWFVWLVGVFTVFAGVSHLLFAHPSTGNAGSHGVVLLTKSAITTRSCSPAPTAQPTGKCDRPQRLRPYGWPTSTLSMG